MTVPQPLARRVERMRHDLARIELAIGPAYTVIRALLPDGYGSGGSDGRGSGIGRPTEIAGIARSEEIRKERVKREDGEVEVVELTYPDIHERIERRVKLLSAGLDELANELVKMEKQGRGYVDAHSVAKGKARCSGGVGHDGYLEWGRPDCEELVGEHSRSGLGDACRMRQRRWEVRMEQERAS